jgi:hypothetical protein
MSEFVMCHALRTSRYSPLYCSICHHSDFNANYSLFMPLLGSLVWHLLSLPKATSHRPVLPKSQQDFVFIGHSCGLGHLRHDTRVFPRQCLPRLSANWVTHQDGVVLGPCYSTDLSCNRLVVAKFCYNSIAHAFASPRNTLRALLSWRPRPMTNSLSLSRRQLRDCAMHLSPVRHTRYFRLGNLN